MYFFALAADYDGTLALHGAVDGATVRCLEELKTSGRRLVLVTGRKLEDLIAVFPHTELFDLLVVENGAVLFNPTERSEELLCEPADPDFVARLQGDGVEPLSVGRAIVATWQPHEHEVLRAIRDLGLELKIVFNKGAVMVLPGGVDKASGIAAALARLKLSPHNVSFYFRGPHGALNLRAQNLSFFLQLAQGVDEQTWLHHLQRGDYSRWFRDAIKDEELADAAAEIEAQAESGAHATRERMKELLTARYAVSAKG